jgi:hypothetical protein
MNLKTGLLVLLIPLISLSYGQNCFCISGTKDKEKGIETVGGVTNTKDYYSLLIQKIMNYRDTTESYTYRMLYNVASKDQFTEDMLKTLGTVELKLTNESTIVIDSVEYQNSPLGFGPTLGFWFYVSEETIKTLSNYPIESISVKDVLRPSHFTKKRKKEQTKIFKCLLLRKPE